MDEMTVSTICLLTLAMFTGLLVGIWYGARVWAEYAYREDLPKFFYPRPYDVLLAVKFRWQVGEMDDERD
jgi:hypothetical protein